MEAKWYSADKTLPDFDKNEKTKMVYVNTLKGELGEAYAYKQSTDEVFWAWSNTMPVKDVMYWCDLPKPPKDI